MASAREKSIRHGHPSTLHLWWARRPLAAARAVIFSQMVDDPSEYVQELVSPGTESRKAAERSLRKQLAAWEARSTEQADEKKPTLEGVAIETERQRLFRLIEELVRWENTTNEDVLQRARDEIWRSWRRTCADNADHPRAKELFDRDKLPGFHDPFAGGGALPLEAQRLGLEAYASDLNPVAVLINKAMIEIPPKFAGMPPVNRDAQAKRDLSTWKGAQGLAEDVRYYGQWMRDEAEMRIGHLYPKVTVTKEMVAERPDLKPYEGKALTVIAWIWARTVKSPNPAFRDVDVPLASTFMLSTKEGKEAYVEVVREEEREVRSAADGSSHPSLLSPRSSPYRFIVKVGKPKDAEAAKNGTKSGGSHSAFLCLMSGTPMPFEYLREEARAKRMGARPMAMVAEGDRGRVYLAPTPMMEAVAFRSKPEWSPEVEIRHWPGRTNVVEYGLTRFGDLFTPRQLVALTTFSDLVQEARERVKHDSEIAFRTQDLEPGVPGGEASARTYVLNATPLSQGGTGATAYADAVAVYLACAVSKMANVGSSIASWMSDRGAFRETFARQAIPMTWDFAESNTFADTGGSFAIAIDKGAMAISVFPSGATATATQVDAASQTASVGKVVSTDPPYYDNIGYADLSDFFYVWLRRSLRPVFPELFATVAVPKAEELVATPYRHGGKEKAEEFFLDGMTQAMHRLAEQAHPAFPVTIYYAFKQSESQTDAGTASTGWETFLDAVIRAGFAICGTWPVRTEGSGRMIAKDSNALASSIVLVCRRREADAPTATRREFLTALRRELASAVADLQRGYVAPVDLQQAAIGPGMAIFTRYDQVLDADGKPLTVRQALAMINQALDEVLAEQEGDFDADTRWALAWFEQFGFGEGEYGTAEVLSKAKATSVQGVVDAGIAVSGKGKVRLLRPEELPTSWTPSGDKRLTVWDMVHHLIRVLDQGERTAADLLAELGPQAEVARELAYRLYAICDRTKRSQDAQRYNALVQSWPEIVRLAQSSPTPSAEDQSQLEFGP